jgi:protein-tyrosine phosphatase
MLPLADTHVHLLAGRDDGPADDATALAMCRMLAADGCRFAAALCHQNPTYPDNTAEAIRPAVEWLAAQLAAAKVPLTVHPAGEVMLSADVVADWQAGRLMSYGGHGKHLLVEMPHHLFLDPRGVAAEFKAVGVRLVIAHAERYAELLHDPGTAERLVAAGCLLQVSAGPLAAPPSAADERALKGWAKRGLVHLLGSDGHGPDRRRPLVKRGYERLAKWAGPAAADRVGSIWGQAVLEGRAVNPPPPREPERKWFAALFGG